MAVPISGLQKWRGIALALCIGSVGGLVFFKLSLPLPWMLGSMIFTVVAAMLGAPIRPPDMMRSTVVVVIGVMLGSGFSPDLVSNIGHWAMSLGFLLAYLVAAMVLVVPFYRMVGKFDFVTAFFAGMPGGLNEMVTLGREMGGDERKIILAHAARVVITISLIAVWFRLILGYCVGVNFSLSGVTTALELRDVAVLLACGVLGSGAAIWLRVPAPTLIGPMLLSAGVHATGITAGSPPRELVIAAQVFLGTIMGCRFLGSEPRAIFQALKLSLGATVLTLAVTLVFALSFHTLFDQTISQVVLAYAPGGLTEMSLVALAMQAEVAYVALHHIVRILMVIAIAPLLMHWLNKRR